MPDEQPKMIIVGGPNGAGKSTIAGRYLRERPLPFLNADLIERDLSLAGRSDARVAAGREFLARIGARIDGRESLAVESTLSGRGFRRTIERAIAAQYAIDLYYVYLRSAELCVGRVHARQRNGGHFVPDEDVRRRYRRSLENFWRLYRPLVDYWLLIENSHEEQRFVATGDAREHVVLDPTRFSIFAEMAGLDSHE
ncbi:MAG: AAA family ATPase [Planctomycetes bacterium]|nr:AAA family ATPase [Planctomycetota bacterium]